MTNDGDECFFIVHNKDGESEMCDGIMVETDEDEDYIYFQCSKNKMHNTFEQK